MAPDGAPPGKFRCGCQRWSDGVRQSRIEGGIAIRASRHSTATRTTPGLTGSAGISTRRLRRWLAVAGIRGSTSRSVARLRRGLAIAGLLKSAGRGTLRLCRTLAIASRGCPTGAAGTGDGVPAVGWRPNGRHWWQLSSRHEASGGNGTDGGSRGVAFQSPPNAATAVIDTAGYPDASGCHPNADMEGIGRLLGHWHPSSSLHLHHNITIFL